MVFIRRNNIVEVTMTLKFYNMDYNGMLLFISRKLEVMAVAIGFECAINVVCSYYQQDSRAFKDKGWYSID